MILFDVPKEAAREISVAFAGADSSFTLRKTAEGWRFADGAAPDTLIMARYLGQLGRVPAQANVEEEMPGKRDSLRAEPPFARFTVNARNRRAGLGGGVSARRAGREQFSGVGRRRRPVAGHPDAQFRGPAAAQTGVLPGRERAGGDVRA